MTHIVCFSGGESSAIVAIEVVRKFGKENVVLLNHDISSKVEDVEEYRIFHELPQKPSFTTLKRWIRKNANLKTHNGDCDYLALISGAYTPFIK